MSKEDDEIRNMIVPPPIAYDPDRISLVADPNIKYLDAASSDIFERYGLGRLGGASGRGWSSISTFQRCPYLFKVKYLDGVRGLPALALELGSAFHTFLALHYRWMREENWELTPYIFKEALLKEGVRPQPVIEAWHLYEAYRIQYDNDYIIPLEEEFWAEDPDGNTCRYDLIARVGEGVPNITAGAWIVEHKGQLLTSRVYTPYGYKLMGDLSIGDEVIDPDGGAAHVTGVFPLGIVDMYDVQLRNGASLQCTSEHLWQARRPVHEYPSLQKDHVWEEVLDTRQLVQSSNANWALPILNPGNAEIEYTTIEVIKPAKRAEAQCIQVDSKRHLYVADHGIITHNTAARFTGDYLEGWKNDGEVIGQIMIWKRAGLDKRFGELRGNIVNIVGKQKVTQFHRTIVPIQRWHVQQHLEDLKMWSALQRLYDATGLWPKSRANCLTRYGKCDLFDSCAENRDPVPANRLTRKKVEPETSTQNLIADPIKIADPTTISTAISANHENSDQLGLALSEEISNMASADPVREQAPEPELGRS